MTSLRSETNGWPIKVLLNVHNQTNQGYWWSRGQVNHWNEKLRYITQFLDPNRKCPWWKSPSNVREHKPGSNCPMISQKSSWPFIQVTIPWGTEDGLNIWRTVQHKPKVDMDTLMSGIQRVSSHGLVLRFLLCPYCAFVHGESTGFRIHIWWFLQSLIE